jgi:uncharacterized protein (TIGR02145 family)
MAYTKKYFLAFLLFILSLVKADFSFGQTVYTFTGNGNWSDTANWLNHSVPPDTLINGSEIIIDSNRTCNLNISQTISIGASLIVQSGANFIVMGNLIDLNYISCGIVTDIDGNVYHTVKIGTQCWMVENLKTTHYADGSPIENISDSTQWANIYNNNLLTPAYCDYYNNPDNGTTYGHLYNWYAVNNPAGLCPVGWHIPTDSEWTVLTNYLGGVDVAGGAMKATTLWEAPNTGATNSSGFAGLPDGDRDSNGSFSNFGNYGIWWSSTENGTALAWLRDLYYYYAVVLSGVDNKTFGFSVRCVSD